MEQGGVGQMPGVFKKMGRRSPGRLLPWIRGITKSPAETSAGVCPVKRSLIRLIPVWPGDWHQYAAGIQDDFHGRHLLFLCFSHRLPDVFAGDGKLGYFEQRLFGSECPLVDVFGHLGGCLSQRSLRLFPRCTLVPVLPAETATACCALPLPRRSAC